MNSKIIILLVIAVLTEVGFASNENKNTRGAGGNAAVFEVNQRQVVLERTTTRKSGATLDEDEDDNIKFVDDDKSGEIGEGVNNYFNVNNKPSVNVNGPPKNNRNGINKGDSTGGSTGTGTSTGTTEKVALPARGNFPAEKPGQVLGSVSLPAPSIFTVDD